MAKAEFKILGVESGSWEHVVTKGISVTYTGQAITYSNMEAATENRYASVTFSGTEISGSDLGPAGSIWNGNMLREITKIDMMDKDVDYIIFDKRVLIIMD